MFAGQDSPKMETCPKNLIIKSDWIPYKQSDELETKLNNFVTKLKTEHNLHIKRLKRASNLSKLQQSHFNFLRNNKDFIILMSGKNLGPAIIERSEYIKLVLSEHLHQPDT